MRSQTASQVLPVVIVGVVSAGAGFLVGACWAARKVGNSLADGLSSAIGRGMITRSEASDILDLIDEPDGPAGATLGRPQQR